MTTVHEPADDDLTPHILRVRLGHGANCSSIGSVVDTLFVVSAVSGAVVAAIAAAMAGGTVRLVPRDDGNEEPPPPTTAERDP